LQVVFILCPAELGNGHLCRAASCTLSCGMDRSKWVCVTRYAKPCSATLNWASVWRPAIRLRYKIASLLTEPRLRQIHSVAMAVIRHLKKPSSREAKRRGDPCARMIESGAWIASRHAPLAMTNFRLLEVPHIPGKTRCVSCEEIKAGCAPAVDGFIDGKLRDTPRNTALFCSMRVMMH